MSESGELVIIESPFSGDTKKNLVYVRKCMRDCFIRGEYPFASHLLYTQSGILDDYVAGERQLGIRAGLSWGKKASKTVVYTDLGISSGMEQGMFDAIDKGRTIEIRSVFR